MFAVPYRGWCIFSEFILPALDVDFDIMQAGGVKTMLFGGEGLFFAKITGPGKVWLQSLPFSRLAGRMLACSPAAGSKRQGEGSVLGRLGDLTGGR